MKEMEQVRRGENPVFEFLHLAADGREIPCQIRLSALPAAGRNLVRATIFDISEQKALQAKVQNQEKMAAIGLLAAGVAHEIGNPLQALSMTVQSLQRKASDDFSKKKLELLTSHIDRISKIVREMSDLARPASRERRRCEVNAALTRAIEVARYDKRAGNTDITLNLARQLPEVTAVEDQLVQVGINLALNAFDAMSENLPDRPRKLTVTTSPGKSGVEIRFEDSGPGIPQDALSRLFQPFYTTKTVGKGTGLGLAVSYRIIQDHGGTLRAENIPDSGARFVIELPFRETP